MSSNTVTVLLVEDVEAIRRAFHKARIANPVEVASDGASALERLRGTSSSKSLPSPYLVLLDLNMPRMNGIEFLEAIRSDEELRSSVVFVLTTSGDDRDKLAAYDKQIAGYMVKAKAGEDFVKLIGMLEHCWRVVEMPPPEGS